MNTGDDGVEPTEEQARVLSPYTAGTDAVIQAYAGTGKTTTLRLVAEANQRRHGVYLVFNRAPAADARKSFPVNIQASTAHSLAYRAVMTPARRSRLMGPRVPLRHVASGLHIRPLTVTTPDGPRNFAPTVIARWALETVETFCRSDSPVITNDHVDLPAPHAAKYLGALAQMQAAALHYARSAWDDLLRPKGALSFGHSHYLKLFQLTDPRLPGDFILFDEAQDANPVIAAIVDRQRHMQRVLVGDPYQGIYGFTGAIDAMTRFAQDPTVTVLPLTQSFRFGPDIAEVANRFLIRLRAPGKVRGLRSLSSRVQRLDVSGTPRSRAVLCRTNAGTVRECLAVHASGRRPALVADVDQITRFLEAAIELRNGRPTSHRDLMWFSSWEDLEYHVENDPTATDLGVLVHLFQNNDPQALIPMLRRCVSEDEADVVVSTVHKAKGREWDSVRVSPDFTLTSKGNQPIPTEELRLAYVAVTRARRVLDPGLLLKGHGGDIS